MEISKLKQTLLNSNGCDTLVPKRNVGELYKLLKPHIHSLSLEDFTNLVGSKKSLEKTFFKPKPYHNKIPKRCLVNDTDDELDSNLPIYPTFLEYCMEQKVWKDTVTGICYKENNYSSPVVVFSNKN